MIDHEEELPSDQQEDASDLNLQENWFAGPALWGTDWTAETIIAQLRRGNINLNPRYQRRNAWDKTRKSLFIESLILGLPIPQIILAEDRNQKGRFIVIDGKQRLLTIRQFVSDADDLDFPQLRLSGLIDRSDLNGVNYASLKSELRLQNDLNSFDNQTIRTIVIRGWKHEKYLYSVFLRINTGSVQLSPQELRQALHPGRFSDLVDDISVNSEPLKLALNIEQPDFRMRDVELVLRWFAYQNFVHSYAGDLKRFLDSTTEYFNHNWNAKFEDLMIQSREFDSSLETVLAIFGEGDQLRKWNGRSFERRINRAVFDIMTFYFSKKHIRDKCIKHGPEIKQAFQDACDTNREFMSSLESTTKSIQSNIIRFRVWASILSEITQLPIDSPI